MCLKDKLRFVIPVGELLIAHLNSEGQHSECVSFTSPDFGFSPK